MTVLQLVGEAGREAHAKRIRELVRDWTKNVFALGKELMAARETFPTIEARGGWARPGWKKWLKEEVGMSEQYALAMIRIFDKLGAHGRELHPETSFKVLKLLSTEAISKVGRKKVIKQLRGKKVTERAAREIVTKHYPKPAKANQIARETGKPTLASDGYIYFGQSKQEAKAIEERRGVVFAVRRAVEVLAKMQVTPDQFLNYALPHQLHKFNEHNQLGKAARWLSELTRVWKKL